MITYQCGKLTDVCQRRNRGTKYARYKSFFNNKYNFILLEVNFAFAQIAFVFVLSGMLLDVSAMWS